MRSILQTVILKITKCIYTNKKKCYIINIFQIISYIQYFHTNQNECLNNTGITYYITSHILNLINSKCKLTTVAHQLFSSKFK